MENVSVNEITMDYESFKIVSAQKVNQFKKLCEDFGVNTNQNNVKLIQDFKDKSGRMYDRFISEKIIDDFIKWSM